MFCRALVVWFAFALGCGGSKVVFPEPRTPADDEEEASATHAVRAPVQTAAVRPANTTPKPAPPNKPEPSTPLTRSQGASAAARNAATATGRDDGEDDRPRNPPHDGAAEPAVALPPDLSAWTHDDFRSAKELRDVRLVQAVSLLGSAGGDADAKARLLVELLDKPAPARAWQGARQTGLPLRGLPQAIVTALAACPSDAARNALKEILIGKLRTNLDDRTFTTAALAALVERGGADAESLVYAVLTMPEAIRPPGRGTFDGAALQRECITLVRASASPQLRERLAEYVSHPSTPAPHRTLLLPMLAEPRGENLCAQCTLALDDFDANNRSAISRQLLVQARRSIDALVQAPDTPQLRAGDDDAIRAVFTALDPARIGETCRAADELWRPEFVERLAQRLGELDSPTDEPDLFALATSLPSDALRSMVHKQLFDHWIDGESLIRLAPFAPVSMRDPGMLLVLKSLPRDDAQARTVPNRARGNSPQLQRLAQERKAKLAWNAAVQTMVATLVRRCEIAGRVARISAGRMSHAPVAQPLESVEELNRLLDAREQSPRKSHGATGDATGDESQSAFAAQLPLELPPAAELETEYHLHWPEQLESRVSVSASPLSIHYARLSVHDQGQRAVAYFARQLPGAKEHSHENGRWLDSAARLPGGKLRSVDVLVTRAGPKPAVAPVAARNAAEDLVIEILCIEISDFLNAAM